MLLNWLRPVAKRKKLPDACMTNRGAPPPGDRPAFAQTFWDQSAWTTMLGDWFPTIPRLPVSLFTQEACTYEGYSACAATSVRAPRSSLARARVCT